MTVWPLIFLSTLCKYAGHDGSRNELYCPGVLVEAYRLSVKYSKWSKGEYNLRSSIKMWVLFGFFVGLEINIVTLSTLKLMDIQGSLVGAVWKVVYFGVGGCLNVWVSINWVEFKCLGTHPLVS
tara:strand:- start:37676 stop:38047 length:372 start_codon:yes stop_codon:yes gene_type:complete